MSTRTKNIETLKQYSNYLSTHQFQSFLSEIKEPLSLPNIDQVPQFKLERLKFELSLDGKNYELKDVFNNVVPTETIPYVFYKKKESREFFAKIYQKLDFPKDWFQIEDHSSLNKEEIGFRILTPNKPKENNFIEWTSESKITFNFELSEITALKDINSIMDTFKTWLTNLIKSAKVVDNLKRSEPKIISLGGRFIISNFILNPMLFSAYVTNDPIAQKYLFFDEYQKKTEQQKKNVYFDILETKGTLISTAKEVVTQRLYTAPEANPLSSVKLTINSDDENKNINVRVLKVSSLDNIIIVLQYFTALIERFKTQKESIIKQYEKVGLVLPVPIVREDLASQQTKTASRLNRLQIFEPKLFAGNYARYCQSDKQPIGIQGSAEVDAYLAERSASLQNNSPPFKLNYSYGAQTPAEVNGDKWYVCVPPPSPPNASKIYPYLLRAKHNHQQTGLLDHDEKRPFVPCCGENNKNLTNWLTGRKIEKSNIVSSIMQPDKIVKEDAKGTLPLAIKEAWNYKNDDYLRLGVKKDPKSFILCLSLAFNEEVESIQKKFVDGVKTFRTQETFGYTPDHLEEIIKTGYVNPYLFLGVAQNALDVQIFLYAVTKKFPKGDVAHPRTAFAYLPPLKTFNRSVVIVVHEDVNPPQCELIVKSTLQKVFFPDDPLVRTCKTILIRSSQVFRVDLPQVFESDESEEEEADESFIHYISGKTIRNYSGAPHSY